MTIQYIIELEIDDTNATCESYTEGDIEKKIIVALKDFGEVTEINIYGGDC